MEPVHLNSVRTWSLLGDTRIASSIASTCPHCGEKVIFSIADYDVDSRRSAVSGSATCPGCSKAVFFWVISTKEKVKPRPVEAVFMYPMLRNYVALGELPPNVPEKLQSALFATIESFNARNYTATTVCARRTLEGIFKFLVAEEKQGASLAKLINMAKEKVDLAAPLTALSHAVRDGGNLGAHFDPDREPSETIARKMVELLQYLISYLYVLPSEIKKLEQDLEQTTAD